MVACPVLDTDFAVIGLGQEERQPDGRQPTIGQTPVEVVRAQVPLQDYRKMELLHEAEKQWYIIHPFVGE